jgi:hypothetical protein
LSRLEPRRAKIFLEQATGRLERAAHHRNRGCIITVAPHFVAQGTIDAMVEEGMVPASVRAEDDLAGSEALKKLIPPPSESGADANAWLAWMKAAMNRWETNGQP